MIVKKLFWALCTYAEYFMWGKLGWKSFVGRPTYILRKKNISIGSRVRILYGARMECGPTGRIIIEDNVSIGPNFNITAYGTVIIKSGVTISANCFITDMDHDISDSGISVMDARNIVLSTTIGKNSFIGANSVILAGTELRHGVVVGANSTVRGIFGPEQIVAGSPAKVKGQRK
jgi:acetyltransferase-like isoleucine patch superfamily enzyme